MFRVALHAVLVTLVGCSSGVEPTCDPITGLPPSPTVDVIDARSGARLCDAVVTIAGMGERFDCESTGCDAPYDCTGPALGGHYAVRVRLDGFADGEKVVRLDDACDPEQFEIEIRLAPPEEPPPHSDGGI